MLTKSNKFVLLSYCFDHSFLMKLPAYSRYDWLLQVLVLPLTIGIVNWIFIGDTYWQNLTTFGLATGLTLIISLENWFVNNFLSLRVDRRYPGLDQHMRRTTRKYIACAVNSCLTFSVLYFLFWLIKLPGFELNVTRLVMGLLFIMLAVLIMIIVYESIHNFGHWEQSRREVDTLSKARLQAQLDKLRQQVNPHFLFNSLNSLISLIDEDPKQAGTYAEELSTVYRYLLRSNETPLVPLSSELEFVDSYYHLLKTRHGDSLTLTTRIEPGTETRQLPPLTLQLLIENAVKHNLMLPEQPLTISLTTDEAQRLIVSNNLQRKPSRALSNGVGLSNILSKYEVLGQPAPVIEDDGCAFRVTLPLV